MDVIVIGAGDQGLVVADAIAAAGAAGGSDRVVAIVDDRPDLLGANVRGVTVAGPVSLLGTIPHDGVIVAVGDNAIRRALSQKLESQGERLASARHPAALVADDVRIGPGSMLSPGVIVVTGATIGRGVLLNTKSSVDHRSEISDFVHVSPGATVGANVFIGEGVLIGLGASVMSGCRIGMDTIVGAGALVVHDLPSGVVAFGVPARIIRRR